MSTTASQHQPGPDGPAPAGATATAATDTPAGRLVIDGEPINVWAERLNDRLVRIDLCTSNQLGCGDAELAHGTLRVNLPDTWRPTDKATAVCLIARIAYQAGAA